MLAPVAKRQTDTKSSVSKRAQRIELATHVGAQIRSAMSRRGWVGDDGKPDVERLRGAVEKTGGFEEGQPRWQTVQFWIYGKSPPGPEYQAALAGALGMTLAELMGIVIREPAYPAWKAFLATPEGASITEDERQALAIAMWPHGPPDVTSYKMMLALIRGRGSA